MTPHETLIAHIEKRVSLSDTDKELLQEAVHLRAIKKRQLIVQPSFTAAHRSYILEGAFRAYVICHQGQEHTIQFGVEDWWITDVNSYFYQKPATMSIVAVEDSKVLQIDYEAEEKLKTESHTFERYFRIASERAVAAFQRRVISNLTLSAEARYEQFMSVHFDVAQRMPQYALASYLGMTTEYLSRLRNKRVSAKS